MEFLKTGSETSTSQSELLIYTLTFPIIDVLLWSSINLLIIDFIWSINFSFQLLESCNVWNILFEYYASFRMEDLMMQHKYLPASTKQIIEGRRESRYLRRFVSYLLLYKKLLCKVKQCIARINAFAGKVGKVTTFAVYLLVNCSMEDTEWIDLKGLAAYLFHRNPILKHWRGKGRLLSKY